MFEQIVQLTKQFGADAIINNKAVPNEKNEAVINETSTTVFSGLKDIVSQGGVNQLAELFTGDNSHKNSNPVIQKLTKQLSTNLGSKLGINGETATTVASSIIPQVISALIGKAKNPNDSSLSVSDIVKSLSGDSAQNSEIMDAISKYGVQFGLDQNADGKVDLTDAMEAVKKNSGSITGVFGKLFGK